SAAIPESLGKLTRLVQDNPVQTRRMQEIASLAEADMRTLRKQADLLKANLSRPAEADLNDLILSSRARSNEIRERITEFVGEEERLRRVRDQELQQGRRSRRIIGAFIFWIDVLGGTLTVLLFSFGIARRLRVLQQNAQKLAQGF